MALLGAGISSAGDDAPRPGPCFGRGGEELGEEEEICWEMWEKGHGRNLGTKLISWEDLAWGLEESW